MNSGKIFLGGPNGTNATQQNGQSTIFSESKNTGVFARNNSIKKQSVMISSGFSGVN